MYLVLDKVTSNFDDLFSRFPKFPRAVLSRQLSSRLNQEILKGVYMTPRQNLVSSHDPWGVSIYKRSLVGGYQGGYTRARSVLVTYYDMAGDTHLIYFLTERRLLISKLLGCSSNLDGET